MATSSSDSLLLKEQMLKISTKAMILIRKADEVARSAAKDLEEAKTILEPHGLNVNSSLLDPTFGGVGDITVLKTTGGHSNTDHIVQLTGDYQKDRIKELKRAYQRRAKSTQPETRGEDRWDKPKIPGERRRRIVREKDKPQAPPEPPYSGYVIFVGQMTTKIRHDRINEQHNQTKVVQEISKIWKLGMDGQAREYYNDFSRQVREEYREQHKEYRATGKYQKSTKFEKLQGTGPWVRTARHERNDLEQEISEYETVQFPLRPPEMDEAYKKRLQESNARRRKKERAAAANNPNIKRRRRRRKSNKSSLEKEADDIVKETNAAVESSKDDNTRPSEGVASASTGD